MAATTAPAATHIAHAARVRDTSEEEQAALTVIRSASAHCYSNAQPSSAAASVTATKCHQFMVHSISDQQQP